MMKTRLCTKAVLLAVALAFVGADTQAQQVTKTVDEFTGTTSWTVPFLELATASDAPANRRTARVLLDVTRVTLKGDSTPGYSLSILYTGDDWLFIDETRALMLLVDGRLQELDATPGTGTRRVLSSSQVVEARLFKVTPSLIRELAAAKIVKVRLVGQRGNVERVFDAATFQAMRNMVAVIDGIPPPFTGKSSPPP